MVKGVKGSHDDLKLVNGVGPATEKALNRLGIRSYRQLATLERDELEKLATKIKISVERIKREKWIKHARQEHFAKYAERV